MRITLSHPSIDSSTVLLVRSDESGELLGTARLRSRGDCGERFIIQVDGGELVVDKNGHSLTHGITVEPTPEVMFKKSIEIFYQTLRATNGTLTGEVRHCDAMIGCEVEVVEIRSEQLSIALALAGIETNNTTFIYGYDNDRDMMSLTTLDERFTLYANPDSIAFALVVDDVTAEFEQDVFTTFTVMSNNLPETPLSQVLKAAIEVELSHFSK